MAIKPREKPLRSARRSVFTTLGIVVLFLVLINIALIFIINTSAFTDTIKWKFITALEEATGRHVEIKSVGLDLLHRLVIEDLVVGPSTAIEFDGDLKAGGGVFLKVDRVTAEYDLIKALQKGKDYLEALERITLHRPVLSLEYNEDLRKWNFADLFKSASSQKDLGILENIPLLINQGNITFAGMPFNMQGENIKSHKIGVTAEVIVGNKLNLTLDGEIAFPITGSGSFSRPKEWLPQNKEQTKYYPFQGTATFDLTDYTWVANVIAKNIDAVDFENWLPTKMGIDIYQGLGDLELDLVYQDGYLDYQGKIDLEEVDLAFFMVPFRLESGAGTLIFNDQGIQEFTGSVYGNGTRIAGRGYTAGGWRDPRFYAEVDIEKGDLALFEGYLRPNLYNIIRSIRDGALPPEAQTDIPPREDGLAFVEDFSLQGLFKSKIVFSGYFSQLSIAADFSLQGGIVDHPKLYTPLRDLEGDITYDDGDFKLGSLTGTLGGGEVDFAGTIDNAFKNPYLNLEINGKEFDLKPFTLAYLNLDSEGTADLDLGVMGFIDQLFAIYEVKAAKGAIEGLSHDGFQVLGRLANGVLEIEDFRAEALGADMKAMGTLGLPRNIARVFYPDFPVHQDSYLEVNVLGLEPGKFATKWDVFASRGLDFSEIEGRIDLSALGRISEWDLNSAEIVGNIESKGLGIGPLDLNLDLLSGGFYVRDASLGLESIQLQVGPANLLASGIIPFDLEKDLDLELSVNTFEPELFAKVHPVLGDLGGRVDLSVQIGGTFSAPSIKGNLDWFGPSFREIEMKRLSGTLFGDLSTRKIGFEEMQLVSLGDKTHKIDGFVDLEDELFVDLNLAVSEQELNEILEPLGFSEYASGPVSFDLSLKGTLDNPFIDFDLTEGPLTFMGQNTTDVRVKASYQDGILLVTEAQGSIGEGSFNAIGSALFDEKSLDLQIKADKIPVEALIIPEKYATYLTGGSAGFRGTVKGAFSFPNVKGELTLEDGIFLGEKIDRAGALFSLEDYLLTVTSSELRWGEGRLSGRGTLDFDSRDVSLVVSGVRADISKAARLFEFNLPEGIRASFGAEVSGKVDDPQLSLDITGVSIDLDDLEPRLSAKIKYSDGIVQINEVNLETNGSSLYLVGHYNLDGNVSLNMQGENISLQNFKKALSIEDDLAGNIHFKANVNGPADNLRGQLELEASDIIYEKIHLSGLLGSFSIDGAGLRVSEFRATLEGNELSVTGTIPWPEELISGDRLPFLTGVADLPLRLSIRSPRSDLTTLNGLVKGLFFEKGQLKVSVDVSGDLKKPIFSGYIDLQETEFLFDPFPARVSGLRGSIVFNGTTAEVENLSANIGTGSAKVDGIIDLSSGSPEFSLNYDLQKVPYKDALVKTVISGKGRLNGDLQRPVLNGQIELESTEIDLAGATLESSDSSLPLVLDLSVDHKGEFRVKGLGIDARGAGSLQVTGTLANLGLDGRVEATSGSVSYLDNEFTINKAQLIFQRYRGIMPQISAEAINTLPDALIRVHINGTVGDLRTALSSDPVMSETDIVRKLTLHRFGTFAGGNIQEALTEEVLRLISSQLETTVLYDVENVMRETFKLDEFRLQPDILGRTMRFRAGKYLFENFYVSYARTFEVRPSEIVKVDYKIGEKTKLTTSLDNKGDFRLGVEFGVSF